MMKKNVLFILVDALRYDVFTDIEIAKKMVPNICALLDQGFIKQIHANGMITQVAMPTILTQSYPLDYDGYNYGIKHNQKSFIELLKQAGYKTHIFVSHNLLGPFRKYERGCDVTCGIFNYNNIPGMFLRHYFYHYIHMWRNKEISSKAIEQIAITDFKLMLNYLAAPNGSVDQSLVPARFKISKKIDAKKIQKEHDILMKDPMMIIRKVDVLLSNMNLYEKFIGTTTFGWRLTWYKIWEIIKKKINRFFVHLTRTPLQIFSETIYPMANEMFNIAKQYILRSKEPWFVFVHIMDVHQSNKPYRFINFLFKFLFLPKLLHIYKKKKSKRNIWYDLTVMYCDRQIGKILNTLKKKNIYEKTLVIVAGDHGYLWDRERDIKLSKDLGFRTHYEHLLVPFIISPTNRKVSRVGMHDSMSISATLLDELGIEPHSSFKGVSVYKPGKKYVITESVGRGNCDLVKRDIYFTVTTEQYKLMVKLIDNKFDPMRFYHLTNDPYEYDNLVEQLASRDIIQKLIGYIYEERQELMKIRNVQLAD